MYHVVLNKVDLPEFTEIHPDMAEDGNRALRCANHQQFYFFIVSWSLQYLVSPIFSNVLQTSRNTLNFSAPLFRGLPCFESFTFFWHIKHNFGSKAFFRFFQNLWAWVEHYEMMMIYFIIEQVMVGVFSICWLLVLSSTTLIHLIMCMWV